MKRIMTIQDEVLGAWMSAALDDPKVCDTMKQSIELWFNTFGEYGSEEHIESELEVMEKIKRLLQKSTGMLGCSFIEEIKEIMKIILIPKETP